MGSNHWRFNNYGLFSNTSKTKVGYWIFKYLISSQIPNNKLIDGPRAGFPIIKDMIGTALKVAYKFVT